MIQPQPKDRGPSRARTRRSGFTLIELLAVIAVVGLLLALLIPAVQQARETARRAHCSNNLRQIGLGLHNYAAIAGCFPPGRMLWQIPILGMYDPAVPCASLVADRSFFLAILPQVEQTSLYNAINQDLSVYHGGNRTVTSYTVSSFVCPDDPDAARARPGFSLTQAADGGPYPGDPMPLASASYAGVQGSHTSQAVPRPSARCRIDPEAVAQANGCLTDVAVAPIGYASIVDGTSTTLCVGERSVSPFKVLTLPDLDGLGWWKKRGWWFIGDTGYTLITTYYPPNAHMKMAIDAQVPRTWSASSLHPGGVNALMADGSIRFIKDSIDSQPLNSQGYPTRFPSKAGVWQALGTRNGQEPIGDY
jgi:prepilin-type N-terminal cleavage/methylation domain-containing protein/prepilin-type processing-associated H-X9-DG protein